MFPVLETERLRLREIETDDAETLFSYFSMELTNRYYGQDPFEKLEDAEQLIELFSANYNEKRGIRWGIENKETNTLIGTIGYHLWSPKHKRAEIGYDLDPDHWGRGFASEALSAITKYGFEVMELTRIGAVVFIDNDASSNLLMKQGFEREGVLREYMYQNGESHDVYMYSLLRGN